MRISSAGTVTDAPTPSSATDAPPRLFVYGTLAPGRSNEHVLVSALLADGSTVSTFVYAIRPAHD